MILEAISLGPLAAGILDQAGEAAGRADQPTGCVVARFDHSAYVEFHRDLLCVVDPSLYDGAINIMCRRLPRRGDRIRLDRRAARCWRPRPLPAPARIRARLDELRRRVADASPLADPFGLLGRGDGLTPEGDDVVCGMMLALRAVDISFEADRLLAAARERTHAISLAHLRAAASGLAAAPVHEALAALVDADNHEPERAFAGLARVGHTSGASVLSGMKAALAAWAHDPDGFTAESWTGIENTC